MKEALHTRFDLIVIGGGPAGLAAACAAWDAGLKEILIIERDAELGGILNQCIHNGFGLHYFKQELTGPEYAGRFVDLLQSTGVTVWSDTMVLQVTREKEVHCVSCARGYEILSAKTVVLAMGCRERTRGAIGIPGDRPAGVMTAGAAQKYINLKGCRIGERVVILGSGDIGLIMARRMSLEGAKVLACVELMPYSNGLQRNITQCLEDYQIPLYLSHTVTAIRGRGRVEQVEIAKVDSQRNPIPSTRFTLDCDTVLLSVGLIPENELTKQAGIALDTRTNGIIVYDNMETSLPGIFACGNVVHVHDIVDFVTAESQRAGRAAAAYCQGERDLGEELFLKNGPGVSYTVPQKIRKGQAKKTVEIFFRVTRKMDCATVELFAGTTLLKCVERENVAPGEMEKLVLPMAKINPLQEPIIISVSQKEV